jgi:hypothetical protein
MVDFQRMEDILLEDVEANQDFINAAKNIFMFLVQWIAAGKNFNLVIQSSESAQMSKKPKHFFLIIFAHNRPKIRNWFHIVRNAPICRRKSFGHSGP